MIRVLQSKLLGALSQYQRYCERGGSGAGALRLDAFLALAFQFFISFLRPSRMRTRARESIRNAFFNPNFLLNRKSEIVSIENFTSLRFLNDIIMEKMNSSHCRCSRRLYAMRTPCAAAMSAARAERIPVRLGWVAEETAGRRRERCAAATDRLNEIGCFANDRFPAFQMTAQS